MINLAAEEAGASDGAPAEAAGFAPVFAAVDAWGLGGSFAFALLRLAKGSCGARSRADRERRQPPSSGLVVVAAGA
jgi:hypothetical protein